MPWTTRCAPPGRLSSATTVWTRSAPHEPGPAGAPRGRMSGGQARSRLRDHLVSARIAGSGATAREANLRSYRNFAYDGPYHRFGLTSPRTWTAEEVLEVMVRRCGVDPDPDHETGPDTIDPERTV